MLRNIGLWLVLGLTALTGCGNPTPIANETPEQRLALAKQAGENAALGYIIIQKPTADQQAALKVVMDKLHETLSTYVDGGFRSTLPSIQDGLAKLFPADTKAAELKLATNLADTLLTQLDDLFAKHPEWKSKNDEVTGIVAAFCSGASKSFDQAP